MYDAAVQRADTEGYGGGVIEEMLDDGDDDIVVFLGRDIHDAQYDADDQRNGYTRDNGSESPCSLSASFFDILTPAFITLSKTAPMSKPRGISLQSEAANPMQGSRPIAAAIPTRFSFDSCAERCGTISLIQLLDRVEVS